MGVRDRGEILTLRCPLHWNTSFPRLPCHEPVQHEWEGGFEKGLMDVRYIMDIFHSALYCIIMMYCITDWHHCPHTTVMWTVQGGAGGTCTQVICSRQRRPKNNMSVPLKLPPMENLPISSSNRGLHIHAVPPPIHCLLNLFYFALIVGHSALYSSDWRPRSELPQVLERFRGPWCSLDRLHVKTDFGRFK